MSFSLLVTVFAVSCAHVTSPLVGVWQETDRPGRSIVIRNDGTYTALRDDGTELPGEYEVKNGCFVFHRRLISQPERYPIRVENDRLIMTIPTLLENDKPVVEVYQRVQ